MNIRDVLVGLLTLAGLAALVMSIFWTTRHWPNIVPAPVRDRAIRWGFVEILLAFFGVVAGPALAFFILQNSGILLWYYGPEASDPTTETGKRALILWATTLGLAVAIPAVLGIARRISATRPRHFGLRLRWVRQGIALGVLGWVLVSPLVLAIHYGLFYLQERVLFWKVKRHLLEQLMLDHGRPTEWVLLTLQAVIVAPLWEELLFRGLLQPKLAKYPTSAHFVWSVALVFGLFHIEGTLAVPSFLPTIFASACWIGGVLITWNESGPESPIRAILATSTLFAMMHVDAWPAPIPLLVLALALGWLAYRTRSILAPAVFHAFFNGISTVLLLKGWVQG